MPTKEGSAFGNLQNRLNKFYVIDETDYTLVGHEDYSQTELYLNYITNNRYYLVQGYAEVFRELPANEKAFGGNNVMTGSYREELVEKFTTVSHNSYIDMAFMVGLVFTGLFMVLIIWRMRALVLEYRPNEIKTGIKFDSVKSGDFSVWTHYIVFSISLLLSYL